MSGIRDRVSSEIARGIVPSLKIVAIGGSITAGQGAPRGFRYSDALPRVLRQLSGLDEETLNVTSETRGFHGANLSAFARSVKFRAGVWTADADVLVIETALNKLRQGNGKGTWEGVVNSYM